MFLKLLDFHLQTDLLSMEERTKLKEHTMNMENARQSKRDSVKNSEAMKATTWR